MEIRFVLLCCLCLHASNLTSSEMKCFESEITTGLTTIILCNTKNIAIKEIMKLKLFNKMTKTNKVTSFIFYR